MNHINHDSIDEIKALAADTGDEFFQSLLNDYINDSRDYLARMDQAIRIGDERTAFEIAHTLKSSSFYVGAHQLSQHCGEFEQLVKTGNFPQACNRAQFIQDEFIHVEKELTELLKGNDDNE